MATAGGPDIERDGLVLSLDGASRRSTLKATQVNNILPDPGNWSTGTGGQTGYSPNGSTSEQNRVSVTDDPWGRTSITWRTTPDSTSGADGGWNSSYYTIDTNYTYRYSMWVRRYTSGTGGNFYMGMNPNPIRNDNDASQSNPYFTYPSISLLTQNQWYLVVAHVFYEGYTGGRHPESGWYENGVKISDKSYGNIGAQDSRWASGTTSARHRAYHYYTTNVNSGIEFAYPRVDKIDGKEPSIDELINRGESGWLDLTGEDNGQVENGLQYSLDGVQSSFDFDGTDDYMSFGTTPTELQGNPTLTVEGIFKRNGTIIGDGLWGIGGGISLQGINSYNTGLTNEISVDLWGTSTYGTGQTYSDTEWKHIVWTYNGNGFTTSNVSIFVNGTKYTGGSLITRRGGSGTPNINTDGIVLGKLHSGTNNYNANGSIANFKIYNRVLSDNEVQQNYNSYKNRFNL